MLKALFAGVSPAPKQGPQKAVFMTAPVSMMAAAQPFLTSSMYTGMEAGYTLNVKPSNPMDAPFKMSAAAQIFSKPPPAQPAMIPWSTINFPFLTLSFKRNSTAPSRLTSARFSVSSRISIRLAFSSSMVYVLLGWNGMAIMGRTLDRSTVIMPS